MLKNFEDQEKHEIHVKTYSNTINPRDSLTEKNNIYRSLYLNKFAISLYEGTNR